MKYLLDTNAVIAILKGDTAVLARLRTHAPGDFALSAIVAHELFYGAYKSRDSAANLARVEKLQFAVVESDHDDAREAGRVRAALAANGLPIDHMMF